MLPRPVRAIPATAPLRWPALLCAAALGLGCAELGLSDLGELLDAGSPVSEATVDDGLREALRVGTQRAVSTLARRGGFADDPKLRLELPEELAPMATALRTVGLGARVDELELAMNRAAERAAGEALPIFASAIASMTLKDAVEILEGPPDAATQYFRRNTRDALAARFEPVVRDAMGNVGLYAAYGELVARYEAIPFAKPVPPDLTAQVTDGTLHGLFDTLAREEARIREDPAARTTALLRRVFGREGASVTR